MATKLIAVLSLFLCLAISSIAVIRLVISYHKIVTVIRQLHRNNAIVLPADLGASLDSWYVESWQSQLFVEIAYGDISWAKQNADLEMIVLAARKDFRWVVVSMALFLVPVAILIFQGSV